MGFRFFLVGILGFSLVSCAGLSQISSNEVIRGVDIPRSDLNRIVEASLPLGRRLSQDQGRVFLSNYFAVGEGRGLIPADNLPERFFAEVAIVGDRRPYLVDIRVYKEVRRPQASGLARDSYQRRGSNKEFAQLVRQRIEMNLSQRREGFNLIDDFRAF